LATLKPEHTLLADNKGHAMFASDSDFGPTTTIQLITGIDVWLKFGSDATSAPANMCAPRELVVTMDKCGSAEQLQQHTEKLSNWERGDWHPTIKRVFAMRQSFGYFHFVNEALPRLAFFVDALLAEPDIFITWNDPFPASFQFLELLGLNRNRLVDPNNMRVEQAFIPEASPCTCCRRHPMAQLRMLLRAGLKTNGVTLKKEWSARHILLVKRTGSGAERRSYKHWAKLEPALRARFPDEKFDVFDAGYEGTTVQGFGEQFANAKVIVGLFGAGLSNMVFALPGTVVIELNRGVARGHMYATQATQLGFRFFGHSDDIAEFVGNTSLHEEVVDVLDIFLKADDPQIAFPGLTDSF
jgi:hypothetical protein